MGHGPVTVEVGKTATVAITVETRDADGKARGTIGAKFEKSPAGPRVESLVDGGPAAKAGILVGDVLVGVEGLDVPLRDLDGKTMNRLVGMAEPGTTYKLKLRRGTETVDVSVTVVAP